MLGLNDKLKNMVKKGGCINVAVVGLGQMGLSLVSHLSGIGGFKVLAVADKNMAKSEELWNVLKACDNEITQKNAGYTDTGYKDTGYEGLFIYKSDKPQSFSAPSLEEILKTDISENFTSRQKSEVNNAVRQNRLVFTNDFSILTIIDSVDIIIDATGNTKAGAEIALGAFCGGKDVVTLNVETDVTIGPILKKISSEKNLVYTLSAGDEPSVLKELYDFADGLGFKIVCAGKGKNNPLDTGANPSTIAEYALTRG